MIILKGSQSDSPFRHQKRLAQLQKLNPKIQSYDAYWIYLIDGDLTVIELDKIKQLLPDAELTQLNQLDGVFVIPRIGTISAWSSKATEIAKICDIENLQRIERGVLYEVNGLLRSQDERATTESVLHSAWQSLYDPLTESLVQTSAECEKLFLHHEPLPVKTIPLSVEGLQALEAADQRLGLALSETEKKYLLGQYQQLKRDPTDVELMMFAQINSEHCRHKIFNAAWNIDGRELDKSLFAMIRNTHEKHPDAVLSAYSDNAAVMKGVKAKHFFVDPKTKHYIQTNESAPFVLKVETHNHPTAISPFPGAATGSGGEIRDEAATGRGAKTKMGMSGFSVSHLHIPSMPQPWEVCIGNAPHMASSLEIMLQGPLGGASFNNEFGRPNVCGYFRNFEMLLPSEFGEVARGYHKPIMIAGGLGQIRQQHVMKREFKAGALLIVLGGPAMAIGLGGGAASSRAASSEQQELDFASVQRSNPEMQRRAYEVIQTCCALDKDNPILSIHDVGAGGLSNALPELVAAVDCGALLELRKIPNVEMGMPPLAIWCNEAQERFVLAIDKTTLAVFSEIAQRERCPFAVLGEAIKATQLTVHDDHFNNNPVDMPFDILFEKLPRLHKQDIHAAPPQQVFDYATIDLADAVARVLQFPAVADKSFLITIGDRSVGGLIARDQMIGPWQVPVSDVAVSSNNFSEYTGQAMAVGERTPIAILHPAASARMAVGEAITNIAAARIKRLGDIVLSANWMAAANYPGEGAALYDAVQAVGEELCPALGIAIPVGKDSLSMQTKWQDVAQEKRVTAPLSLIVTAAANVTDVRKTLTPQLKNEDSVLLLIDLGEKTNAMGGSVLLQVFNAIGDQPPDVDNPVLLKNFFDAVQTANEKGLLLAYHDRSDGGLLATIAEMMFCSHLGVDLQIQALGLNPFSVLFNEELGAVVQVRNADFANVQAVFNEFELSHCVHTIGHVNQQDQLTIKMGDSEIYKNSRVALQKLWSRTSYEMQKLRDNPECAEQEYKSIEKSNRGINTKLTFELDDKFAAPFVSKKIKPRVAILREQGVNGHVEMAAAFTHAGFATVDVHMSDILSERVALKDFQGLAACGGFSYGDVLGAGRGWAQSILMHAKIRDEFAEFFQRDNTFTLGVCNGCQMLAQLKSVVPGSEHWPTFIRNQSEQFEARLVMVEVMDSPSIFLNDMRGSVLPVVVSHGEGFANFKSESDLVAAQEKHLVALRYVDYDHNATQQYPANPNGSPYGITGITSRDGRVLMLMPHPERVFLTQQLSYAARRDAHYGPWFKIFLNARLAIS